MNKYYIRRGTCVKYEHKIRLDKSHPSGLKNYRLYDCYWLREDSSNIDIRSDHKAWRHMVYNSINNDYWKENIVSTENYLYEFETDEEALLLSEVCDE